MIFISYKYVHGGLEVFFLLKNFRERLIPAKGITPGQISTGPANCYR